ncbi:MAG: lipoate--protein ligase family protein, partial [Proteobacteria bacterium]|nr:lipoate--protein ligase family protein [Pseudomonadota bacterium]
MHLYRLGTVSWQDSQLAYHALAHLGRQGLILCSPAEPYVSVGYFQDPAQELDLEHCCRSGLPVFRREVGGGAVYLDRHQLFWQVVLRRDHPLVSLNREAFYRRFLAPVLGVYRALGVEARVAPVNDVAVERRRIAGTGAGEVGDCVVFVGNLMRRFDCAAMAQVLRAPDPEFRRSFQQYMERELTSLRRELGEKREAALSDDELYGLLAREFASVMGPLEPHDLDDELRGAM